MTGHACPAGWSMRQASQARTAAPYESRRAGSRRSDRCRPNRARKFRSAIRAGPHRVPVTSSVRCCLSCQEWGSLLIARARRRRADAPGGVVRARPAARRRAAPARARAAAGALTGARGGAPQVAGRCPYVDGPGGDQARCPGVLPEAVPAPEWHVCGTGGSSGAFRTDR